MKRTTIGLLVLALGAAVPAWAGTQRPGPPATFEEFQARQKERFEKRLARATPEQQARMKARRERREQRLAAMSPEQKASLKARWEKRRARWEKMSPEQRARVQARMKDRRRAWKAMTPEERAQRRARMEERRKEWRAMTPEERRAAKAEWRKTHRRDRRGRRGERGEARTKSASLKLSSAESEAREERLRTIESRLTPEQVERFRQERERMREKVAPLLK